MQSPSTGSVLPQGLGSTQEHAQEKRLHTRTSSLHGQPPASNQLLDHCVPSILLVHFPGPLSKALTASAHQGSEPRARAGSRSVCRALPGGRMGFQVPEDRAEHAQGNQEAHGEPHIFAQAISAPEYVLHGVGRLWEHPQGAAALPPCSSSVLSQVPFLFAFSLALAEE